MNAAVYANPRGEEAALMTYARIGAGTPALPWQARQENDMRFYRLTRPEAEKTVRALISNFYDETPADLYDEADFQGLAEQLSWILHGTVSVGSVGTIYDAFDDLAKIERGIHPRLRRNGAFTLDNTPDLLDIVDRNLTEGVYFLLQDAGFIARVAFAAPQAVAA